MLYLLVSVLLLDFELFSKIVIDGVYFLAIEIAVAVLVVLLEELQDCLADLVVGEGHYLG